MLCKVEGTDVIRLRTCTLSIITTVLYEHSCSSRVQFMLEVLLAVKNNNVNKIPNYDTTHFEHLRKTLKIYIRDGNFVSVMKIGLKVKIYIDDVTKIIFT